MIICVKSISNFMCISSSVSHELCGHAKGQERNLSTLFGRTRRLRWGKLFWRRHLILHFCKTYIFATFMRKCQVWWVKEWLFVLYQRNIYFRVAQCAKSLKVPILSWYSHSLCKVMQLIQFLAQLDVSLRWPKDLFFLRFWKKKFSYKNLQHQNLHL